MAGRAGASGSHHVPVGAAAPCHGSLSARYLLGIYSTVAQMYDMAPLVQLSSLCTAIGCCLVQERRLVHDGCFLLPPILMSACPLILLPHSPPILPAVLCVHSPVCQAAAGPRNPYHTHLCKNTTITMSKLCLFAVLALLSAQSVLSHT